MVTDLRHLSGHSSRKVAPNRMKVRKEPVDLRKYLLPLLRFGGKAGILLLVAGLLIVSIKTFKKSNPFPVQKVEIRGNQMLTYNQIVALTGITQNSNLFQISLKDIGQKVASNNWVESVRIQRFFPGTLVVNITERKPVAVINMGLLYYIDKKGEPFKPLTSGDSLDFPVVSGISEEDINNEPAATRDVILNACTLLEALKQNGFVLADVSEINYDNIRGFTLYTTSTALPVKIGFDDFDNKLKRFARIYQNIMTQKPVPLYVDIDYRDRIVVRKG